MVSLSVCARFHVFFLQEAVGCDASHAPRAGRTELDKQKLAERLEPIANSTQHPFVARCTSEDDLGIASDKMDQQSLLVTVTSTSWSFFSLEAGTYNDGCAIGLPPMTQ